jgi:hypothetical protein
VAQAGGASPVRGLTFEAEAAPSFVWSNDLLDLEDVTRLSRREFDSRAMRARSPQALQACQDGTLFLALDDQSPRPLLQAVVPLRSVVDEDRELGPGWHLLVAFVRSPEQTTLQTARFQLETELPEPPSDSQCVLLEPAGTVVPKAGAGLRLLAAPLAAQVDRFEYHVGASQGSPFRTRAHESVQVHGLALGDHRVGVRCYDESGTLVGRSERIVTVDFGGEFDTP